MKILICGSERIKSRIEDQRNCFMLTAEVTWVLCNGIISLKFLFDKKIAYHLLFLGETFLFHVPLHPIRDNHWEYVVSSLPWRRSLLIHLWLPHILSWFALPDHLQNLWGTPFSLRSRRRPDWQCRMKWWLGWKTTISLQLFWSIELWASALILWWYRQSKRVKRS